MGYLLRLASDDRVLKTIEYAQTLYLNSDDATTRSISAEILHASSKLSNDRFMAFATSALPFVFVCKHDGDEHVRDAFEKTWQDNVGGSRAVSLYIREIVSLVSDNLDSARWAIKHTAARAIAQAVLALDAEIDLPTALLVWPVLEKALAGKTWDGKEVLLTALVKFARAAQALWTARPELGALLKVSFFSFSFSYLFSCFFFTPYLWALSLRGLFFYILSLFLSGGVSRLVPRFIGWMDSY
jgi:proteasome component ECM29